MDQDNMSETLRFELARVNEIAEQIYKGDKNVCLHVQGHYRAGVYHLDYSTGLLIDEFELIDHGIEHSQYFQGCGVSFTEFTDVSTGIGEDPAEAIEDAINGLAEQGWLVDTLEDQIKTEEGWTDLPKSPNAHKYCEAEHDEDCEKDCEELHDHDECENHYMVSIRVK